LPRISGPDVIGCTYINLAGVYLGDGLVGDALSALTKAEDCFRQLRWSDEIATTQLAQAMGYIDKEDWDEARSRLVDALQTLEAMPDAALRAAVLNQLGRVDRTTGNLDGAEGYLQQALVLVANGNLNERGLAQRELGLCARSRGNAEEARRLLLDAIDSYRASSNAHQVGVTFMVLGDVEAERGDALESSRFYREGLEAATASAL